MNRVIYQGFTYIIEYDDDDDDDERRSNTTLNIIFLVHKLIEDD